jgi:glycosyltransferase involved in cell wall biosynthesis
MFHICLNSLLLKQQVVNAKTRISEMLTFIIIPVYNESQVIYKLLENDNFKKYQLILVDDGSKDNLSLNEITVPFYFLQHSKNLGQGAALQTGMELARLLHADIAVHFDGDGQHNPDDIEQLIEPILFNKADVVLGSRFLKKEGAPNLSKIPYPRKIILQCARIIQFFFTGLVLTDSQNGLRAISGKKLHSIEITENRMAHAIELIQVFKHEKLLITEAAVKINYTKYSNEKGQNLLNGFFIVIRLFLNGLIKYTWVSAVFMAGIIGLILHLVNKNESSLFEWESIIFFYVFNLGVLFLIRKRKRRLVAATQKIRHDAIQKVINFNQKLPIQA